MPTDAELLRAYADEKSESAFGELVRRHVNLVYSVALRQCGGDAHLAEDVTQHVFTDLARKARSLSGHAVLGGWLFRSAQFAASDVVRAERRRRVREQEASAMQELSRPAGDADWQKLAPVLDRAIGELAAPDRDAVVLRFFEGRPFAEIGATLRLTEDAARMRVERALDKLRVALGRQGIMSTAAALGVALANQAVATAPAGIAASVTGAAMAGIAAGGGIAAAATFMSITKMQLGMTGVLVAAMVAGLTVQQRANARLREEIDLLHKEFPPVAQVLADNEALTRAVADVALLWKSSAELASLRRSKESMENSLRDLEVMDARNERIRKSLEDLASRPLQGAVFDESAVDRPPKPAFQFQPIVPRELYRAGVDVEVVLQMTIDTDGSVRSVSTLRATPEEFGPVVAAQARRWEFAPAQKDGQAVNARIVVPVRIPMGRRDGALTTPRRPEKLNWF